MSIFVDCQNEVFQEKIFDQLSIQNFRIQFVNKYFSASVPVHVKHPETGGDSIVAHIVHYVPGMEISAFFSKFPDSQIRVLLVPPELSAESEKLSEVCFENSAEAFVWDVEDDVAPGPRLRQVLECHPWAETASVPQGETPEISFEELLAEIQQVKDLCAAGTLSDDERRELAAATALKLARLLGEDDLCISD